jgi:hypothetical protein
VLASSYLTEREFASPKSTEPIPSFNRFAAKLGFSLHHEDSDGPDFARQTRGPGSRDRLLALFMKKKLSHAPATGESRLRSPEGTTTAKVVGAGITGMLSFVSAVFTTVVESGGFWQYFWLGTCILFFVCAAAFVILATREGLHIDHTGLEHSRPFERGPLIRMQPGKSLLPNSIRTVRKDHKDHKDRGYFYRRQGR